jgi:hypothetical protein
MTITRIAQIAAVLSATMLSACGGPGGEIGIRESGASSSTRGAAYVNELRVLRSFVCTRWD